MSKMSESQKYSAIWATLMLILLIQALLSANYAKVISHVAEIQKSTLHPHLFTHSHTKPKICYYATIIPFRFRPDTSFVIRYYPVRPDFKNCYPVHLCKLHSLVTVECSSVPPGD